MDKKRFYAIYDDEDDVLNAVKIIKQNNISIVDVFTPFPIHGLDHALGLNRTRLGITAFIYGCIGFIVAYRYKEKLSKVV